MLENLSSCPLQGLDDLYDRLVLEIGHRQEATETVTGGCGQAADSEEEGDALETSLDDIGGGCIADQDERCIVGKSFSPAEEGSVETGAVSEAGPASEVWHPGGPRGTGERGNSSLEKQVTVVDMTRV